MVDQQPKRSDQSIQDISEFCDKKASLKQLLARFPSLLLLEFIPGLVILSLERGSNSLTSDTKRAIDGAFEGMLVGVN